MISYGAINSADIRVLEMVLGSYRDIRICLLEIGIHTGTTARGIRDFCAAQKTRLEYWGLDNGLLHPPAAPFEGANLVIGDSAESFHLVPDSIDVVIVDGCHSRNHVILDTFNYASKVPPGGFLLFHDTSPEIQQTMREGSGPDIPQFYNSVNEALKLMRFPWPEWSPYFAAYEPGCKFGGTTAYRRELR